MHGKMMNNLRGFNARNETVRIVLTAAVACSGFHGATVTLLAALAYSIVAFVAILMLDRRTNGFLSNRGGALLAAGALLVSVTHVQGYAPWVSALSSVLLLLASLEAFEITYDAHAVAVLPRIVNRGK